MPCRYAVASLLLITPLLRATYAAAAMPCARCHIDAISSLRHCCQLPLCHFRYATCRQLIHAAYLFAAAAAISQS